MSNENTNIKLDNFVPLNTMSMKLVKDEDTGIESLILSGIAHGYKRNLKLIKISQSAARKAVRKFNADHEEGRIHQIWIDHAYMNPTFFGNPTPSEKVIGHLEQIKAKENGLNYVMNLNTEHPAQIHKAILRKDFDGVSIGANVEFSDITCSVDNLPYGDPECDHYIGQKLENGERAGIDIHAYDLDELSVTAKPADPEGKINQGDDSSKEGKFMLTIKTFDKDGKFLHDGLFDKDKLSPSAKLTDKDKLSPSGKITDIDKLVGESFKKTENYDKDDNNMTGHTEGTDASDENANYVSKGEFDELKTLLSGLAGNIKESNETMGNYIKSQDDKKVADLLALKEDVIERILQKSDDFDKEGLLDLSLDYLEKFEKALTPKEEGDNVKNADLGVTQVFDEDNLKSKEVKLSRNDLKAWMRFKMGYKTPSAPVHITQKVRARLRGETVSFSNIDFGKYLSGKYGESDK